ncbi:MAG: hypothetical protein K2G23_07895, partial [Muribaculaceae bacterium]|nr:hypothetical protein [Muribaculaceae bacterium]
KEYYIDEDPGKGYGTSVNHGHSKIVKFDVNTDNLPLGAHTLSVRLLDQQGKWGEVMTRPFVVGQKAPDTDLVLEYFYDVDPGVGNANKIAVSEGENIMYLPLDGLGAGAHIFGVRCMDKAANWTQTIVNPLYVVDRVALSKAEYYVDDDPGEGKGNGVAIGGDGKSAFAVPTADLNPGTHQLVMRGLNEDDKWITLFSRPFEVRSESTGVENIIWKLGFSYTKTSSGLKLESTDIPDGSIVSVIALNGQKLAETIWSDTTQPLYVDFNYAGVAVLHIQTPNKEISAKLVN